MPIFPTIEMLSGIELIETGYAPRNVALLIGRRDTRIHYDSWRSDPLFMPDKEIVGKIDFNTGEMEMLKYANIQEIRADEPTMRKLKDYFSERNNLTQAERNKEEE